MRLSLTDLVGLTLLLALALARPLTAPPITLHGEAREGLVVQGIVAHGHWVLAVRNGALPSKPPCFHWIAAALARGFGSSDVVVRLPSALATWAMTVTTFVLGVEVGGHLCGWLAVGALWGIGPFWMAAAEARVDMLFAAWVTMALAAFLLCYRGAPRSRCSPRGRWVRLWSGWWSPRSSWCRVRAALPRRGSRSGSSPCGRYTFARRRWTRPDFRRYGREVSRPREACRRR